MANDYYANVTGPQSCTSSRWLTEEVYKLIDMVQHDEAIYNPRHKYYFCRPYVETFWREVDQKLEKNPGASLAKWTNLRISFRREYTNYLEEKVPPCWTYFDRMFFLHPYLRKKHSQPKSLDSQMQDALVRINSLSNRFHRERTATATAAENIQINTTSGDMQTAHLNNQPAHQQQLDNYLEYFDDPEQNNSDDLDDVVDDDQQRRRASSFRHAEPHPHQHQDDHDRHTLNNDIKSECDDVKSDVDEYESESVVRQEEVDNELLEEMEMRNFMMDTYANSSSAISTQNTLEDKRAQHIRMQHLMRLQQQTRAYTDLPQVRVKRPRSQESISSTEINNSGIGSDGGTVTTNVPHSSSSSLSITASASSSSTGAMSGASHARMHYSSASTAAIHANVSFVRPTLAKPVELVSTTTSNNGSVGLSVGAPVTLSAANALGNNADTDLNASSTSNVSNQLSATTTLLNQHQRHSSSANHNNHNYNSHHHHHHSGSSGVGGSSVTSGANHHRLDFAAITGGAGGGATSNNGIPTGGTTAVSAALMNSPPIPSAPVPPAHMELCDCKTDPDAMFLMSLLPDIQKLNGRDRGKIKIAFQNILQDYLYPD